MRWYQICTLLVVATLTFNVYWCFHAYLEDQVLPLLGLAAILCGRWMPKNEVFVAAINSISMIGEEPGAKKMVTDLRELALKV
jgi:hypothetical protein